MSTWVQLVIYEGICEVFFVFCFQQNLNTWKQGNSDYRFGICLLVGGVIILAVSFIGPVIVCKLIDSSPSMTCRYSAHIHVLAGRFTVYLQYIKGHIFQSENIPVLITFCFHFYHFISLYYFAIVTYCGIQSGWRSNVDKRACSNLLSCKPGDGWNSWQVTVITTTTY